MYKKKQHEVEQIIKGGRMLGEILDKLAAMAVPGACTLDIDAEAERMILEVGGIPAFKGYKGRKVDPAFPAIICASVNSEIVHAIPTREKVLKDGDIFTIDIGMKWPKDGGYFTDTALTIAVGEVAEETLKLMDATKKALDLGIKQAKSGNTIADIGKNIQNFIDPLGYGIVRDLVGHGVGHAVHEEPRVPNFYDKNLETWLIEPGVVIAIEPMITIGKYDITTGPDGWTINTVDGSLSAHYEHTICVTEDGPVVATLRPSEKA